MLFEFGLHSSLLLPFVVPGAVATLWLLLRGLLRNNPPDVLLALLLALPTLAVTQWMLGYAGWYDSHDWHSTFMFYVPWHIGLLIGPAYYLYFRSLTNQAFRWWPTGRHLLTGVLQVGLFAGAAVYDLIYYRGLNHYPLVGHFGTKGPAAAWLDSLAGPLAWLGNLVLLGYALRTLVNYRRYRRYLDDNFSDPERLRFAGLRQLLALQLVVLIVSLIFAGLDEAYDFSYHAAWYFYLLRGALIYGFVAVGVQANYAATSSPLRFEELLPAAEGKSLGPLPAALLDGAPTLLPVSPSITTDSALSSDLLSWRERLLRFMDTERPWLEPELTLADLARRLGTTPTMLSKIINQGCRQNFSDFINTYRVAEARRKLGDPHFAHYSLLGIAFESGFNSKSTFNRVFKKLTEQAPGEFIRPKT